MAPGQPQQCICLLEGREWDFCRQHEDRSKGVHAVHCWGGTHWLQETSACYRCWTHCISILWVKHYSNQCLQCWVLLGNSEPIEDAVSWGLRLVLLWSLRSSRRWESSPGIGSWIFLIDRNCLIFFFFIWWKINDPTWKPLSLDNSNAIKENLQKKWKWIELSWQYSKLSAI